MKLRWLIYTTCWSDPTSGNSRHQKAFMLSRGMPIYLHLPLLLRRDQSSYGMIWLWYYFPHIGGDCRTFNIWWMMTKAWLVTGPGQGDLQVSLGEIYLGKHFLNHVDTRKHVILSWLEVLHPSFIRLQKIRNEHLCTSSSSWDPKEAEHLHAARYLNYATNTVVKSAKLVPTLIISVGKPRGFQGLAWLF